MNIAINHFKWQDWLAPTHAAFTRQIEAFFAQNQQFHPRFFGIYFELTTGLFYLAAASSNYLDRNYAQLISKFGEQDKEAYYYNPGNWDYPAGLGSTSTPSLATLLAVPQHNLEDAIVSLEDSGEFDTYSASFREFVRTSCAALLKTPLPFPRAEVQVLICEQDDSPATIKSNSRQFM